MNTRTPGKPSELTLLFLDAETGKLHKSYRFNDSLLDRLSSSVLSPDEQTLWLMTAAFEPPLASYISSVLFRVDLSDGTATRCLGPENPRSRTDWRDMRVFPGPEDSLYLVGYEPKTISQYFTKRGEVRRVHRIDGEPYQLLADHQNSRMYVLTRERELFVLDGKGNALARRAIDARAITVFCLSPDKIELYIGGSSSNNVTVLDARLLETRRSFTLYEPQYLRSHGGIDMMRFDKSSRTLLAVGRGGGGFFAYDLEKQKSDLVDVRGVCCVRAHPSGEYLYTCNSYSGNISIVDAARGQNLGTIQVGGQPRDIDFLHDDNHAVVADLSGERVVFVDLERKIPVGETKVGGGPVTLEMSEDGKLCYVYLGGRREPVLIDTASRKLTHRPELTQYRWSPDSSRDRTVARDENGSVWVEVRGVWSHQGFINVHTHSWCCRIPGRNRNTISVALDTKGRWAYVTCERSSGHPVLRKLDLSGPEKPHQ
ncbi:hypothetical protein ACFLU6_08510 [Acidobacteriota bacterium]